MFDAQETLGYGAGSVTCRRGSVAGVLWFLLRPAGWFPLLSPVSCLWFLFRILFRRSMRCTGTGSSALKSPPWYGVIRPKRSSYHMYMRQFDVESLTRAQLESTSNVNRHIKPSKAQPHIQPYLEIQGTYDLCSSSTYHAAFIKIVLLLEPMSGL